LQIVWDNGKDWSLPGWTQEQADAACNKLRSQRLVCQEFNKIITPLVYNSIDLTKYSLMTLLTNASAPPSEDVKVFCSFSMTTKNVAADFDLEKYPCPRNEPRSSARNDQVGLEKCS
jgi:hypothetical protein